MWPFAAEPNLDGKEKDFNTSVGRSGHRVLQPENRYVASFESIHEPSLPFIDFVSHDG